MPLFEGEHYRMILSLTIAELAVGIMLMRDPSISVSGVIAEMHAHGRLSVGRERVQGIFDDMRGREWIVSHPTECDRFVMTSAGERVLWSGFNSLVGMIDQGNSSFEAAMLWSLVTRRSPDGLNS